MDYFLLSFITYFATLSPINVLIFFMTLSVNNTSQERIRMAFKAVFISTVILVISAVLGAGILEYLGIHLYSLRVSGGILLFMVALGMILGNNDAENVEDSINPETRRKKDISVYPLAMPIISGPGSIMTGILLFNDQVNNTILSKSMVFLALFSNLAITLVLLLISDKIITRIKRSTLEIFLRVAGLILASLAVQFVFDGIKESGVFFK